MRPVKRAGQGHNVKRDAPGKSAEVTVESDTYPITVDDGTTITAARTRSADIRRHKASSYPAPRRAAG